MDTWIHKYVDIRILVKKEKKIAGSMEKGIEEMEKMK